MSKVRPELFINIGEKVLKLFLGAGYQAIETQNITEKKIAH